MANALLMGFANAYANTGKTLEIGINSVSDKFILSSTTNGRRLVVWDDPNRLARFIWYMDNGYPEGYTSSGSYITTVAAPTTLYPTATAQTFTTASFSHSKGGTAILTYTQTTAILNCAYGSFSSINIDCVFVVFHDN